MCLCAQWSAQATEDVADLSLEQLLTVNIIGASKYEQKQSEVAAAVSVITRADIKTFGWRTLDEALASLPGIYTTYDRQFSNLGTRGFAVPGDFNTRVLVLINGNRANDPTFDAAPFGLAFSLDMDLIDRIEFIPGPGGAVYGQNAMFGVVNVITRSGAMLDGAELSAATQRRQGQREGRASWGKLFDNGVDVLLSVSSMRARGEDLFFTFPGSAVAAGVALGLDASSTEHVFARLARGPWSFEHLYGNVRKDDPTAAFHSNPLVPGQYKAASSTLTQLQYQDSFAGESLRVSARVYSGQFRFRVVANYGSVHSSPARADWYGAEARVLATAIAGHKLMLGVEAQDNVRTDVEFIDLANRANDIRIPGSSYRFGLYAQDEWSIGKTLSSTLGLRLDRSGSAGSNISPRAALIWQAAPATTVKALYGRAKRTPNVYEHNFADDVAQVNNPALSGETIDTMELVLDQGIGHDLSLRGTVYQWTMQGLVVVGSDVLSGLLQYHNGEPVRAHGMELSGEKNWGWGARLRANLSYQGAYYTSGANLMNSPHLMGKLNFSSPLPASGLRMGYALQYYSARQSIDGSNLDGYWLSNLNLTADKLARGLELSVGLYNLFDRRYEHPGGERNWQKSITQDGRTLRFKLDYRY
ncbi:MAG: TonB-dependent receptor [Massilia sp.]|nr:TonB-dependent receptor [Massilia sp.]